MAQTLSSVFNLNISSEDLTASSRLDIYSKGQQTGPWNGVYAVNLCYLCIYKEPFHGRYFEIVTN